MLTPITQAHSPLTRPKVPASYTYDASPYHYDVFDFSPTKQGLRHPIREQFEPLASPTYTYNETQNALAQKREDVGQTSLVDGETRVEIRKRPLGGIAGKLGFTHSYQVVIGSDGKELFIISAGAAGGYDGGSSAALFDQTDGVHYLKAEVIPWEGSHESQFEYKTMGAYIVNDTPVGTAFRFYQYAESVNKMNILYSPRSNNCHAFTSNSARAVGSQQARIGFGAPGQKTVF